MEVLAERKRGNITPFLKRKRRKTEKISLTSAPGKIMEQILLEIVLRHIENNKVSGKSTGLPQAQIVPGKWWNGWISTTALVGNGRMVIRSDVLYLGLC